MTFRKLVDHDVMPEGRVVDLAGVSIRLDQGPHPSFQPYLEEIADNWTAEHEANPALYNGIVLMASSAALSGGQLSATVHRCRFSDLLWWRKNRSRAAHPHVFCMALPVTTEGELLAIEMAAHTSNAGKVYCASGTLDETDVADLRIDAEANMMRELAEETGLVATSQMFSGPLRVVFRDGRLVVIRLLELGLSKAEAEESIRRHMNEDHEKEIARPVFISKSTDFSGVLAGFMPPILDWYFNQYKRKRG